MNAPRYAEDLKYHERVHREFSIRAACLDPRIGAMKRNGAALWKIHLMGDLFGGWILLSMSFRKYLAINMFTLGILAHKLLLL